MVQFYLAENTSLKSTHIILNNIQCAFRSKISLIICDRGPENIGLKQTDLIFDQSRHVNIQILDGKMQKLNISEASVKVFRRFIKSIFNSDDKRIPRLTITQFLSLIILVQKIMNQRPCLKYDLRNLFI